MKQSISAYQIIKEGGHMAIKTNKELSQAIDDLILNSGIKKTFISEKLGISRQALDNMMTKSIFPLMTLTKSLIL